MMRVGSRWRSQCDNTEVIVIRASLGVVGRLTCGGHPMVDIDDSSGLVLEMLCVVDGGTRLGKRYADPDESVEVLVTKAGEGMLALDAIQLIIKESKPLPASD
jgi:hypothetical protein